MRISIIHGDPDFISNPFDIKVFLEGIEFKYAVTADEEQGLIVAYKRVDSQFVIENDELVTEEIRGHVRIETPVGWKPIR